MSETPDHAETQSTQAPALVPEAQSPQPPTVTPEGPESPESPTVTTKKPSDGLWDYEGVEVAKKPEVPRGWTTVEIAVSASGFQLMRLAGDEETYALVRQWLASHSRDKNKNIEQALQGLTENDAMVVYDAYITRGPELLARVTAHSFMHGSYSLHGSFKALDRLEKICQSEIEDPLYRALHDTLQALYPAAPRARRTSRVESAIPALMDAPGSGEDIILPELDQPSS